MEMYAVIRDRGREFKVREGDVIQLDRNRLEKGETIEFDEVLLCGGGDDVEIGRPLVSGAKVTGEVLGETKAKKTVIIKFRRRKDSRTRKGHRQTLTSVKITSIQKP
jgi:large subunit ribosomal protein L21